MNPSIDHNIAMADIYRRDPVRAQESLIEAFENWSYEEILLLCRQMVLAFPAPAEPPAPQSEDYDQPPSPDSLARLFARVGLHVAITPAHVAEPERTPQAA